MSRKRKPTIKELEDLIDGLATKVQQTQEIVGAIIGELNGVAGLIVTHLEEEGKMRRVDCPNCGHTNNIPLMEGFPYDGLCIACGVSVLDEEE